MRWWTTSVALGLAACGGDDETSGTDEPIESYACTQIATGEILDVAASREEARTLTVGRTPYRVNLMPGVAGFVAIDSGGTAADLTLLLSDADVAAAWWNGGDRVAFSPGEANPGCDADIAEVQQFTTSGGPAWLELGPALQGSVWLMLGE